MTSPANCTIARTIIYLFFWLVWSSARDLKLSSSPIVSSPCAKRLQFRYFMLILMFKLYPFKLNVYLPVVFFIPDVRTDVSTMRFVSSQQTTSVHICFNGVALRTRFCLLYLPTRRTSDCSCWRFRRKVIVSTHKSIIILPTFAFLAALSCSVSKCCEIIIKRKFTKRVQ